MQTSPITRAAPRRVTPYLTVASYVALSCLIVGLTATCTVGQDKPVAMTPEIAKKMVEARARAAAAGQPIPGQPAPGQPAPDGAKPAGDDAKKDDAKKDEGKDGDSGGVKRPDEPAEPADPEELKVRPDDDGKISFIFKGQPWTGVLEWLADISEMSLEWQEVPSGFLNLRTRQRYTVDEVRDLINSVLLARGYTLLRSGEILMVVKLEGLDVSLVPRVTVDELDDRGTYEIVKTFFDLNRLRAETVAEELKPLLSKYGKISAMKTTNRIEVVETAGNLRRLREMLADEQGASGQELEIREFPLQYVHAEDALATLETLLGTKKEAGPPMSPQEMQQMQQMQQMRQQQQQQQGGAQPPEKDEPKVHLAVNRRNNSVVAHAPPDQLAVIEKAISYLDVPSNGPASASPIDQVDRIRNYRLTQADPDSVIKVLRDVGGLSPSTQLTIDKNGKSIIASASLVDHYIIEELVKRLNGSERTFHVIELRRLSAEYVAGSIEFLMHGEEKEDNNRGGYYSYRYGSQESDDDEKGEFQVEADTENNRLLLRANEAEKEEIYDLLAKLGEDPRQAGDGPTTRLIRTLSGDETEQLLERLQHAWPSLSPNPLQIQPAPESDDPKDDGTEQHDTPKPEVNDASNEASVSPPEGFGFLLAAIDDPDAQPADAQPADAQPADIPSADAPRPATAAAPPVSITRGPEGLVITCQDPAALEAFFDLAEQLSPRKQGYHKFALTHTYAREVAYLLEDIFDEEEKEEEQRRPYWYYYEYGSSSSDDTGRGRLSDRRPLKFVPDPVTNTILVLNADTKQLAEIKSLIEMYDNPDSIDSESVRKTEIVSLKYGDAEDIAEVVKDVYRDLLSPNDKALLKNAQPQQQQEQRYSFWDTVGDDDDDTKVPRFKGLLSIGIEKKTNQLVVSSPQFLLDIVLKMIGDLDEAAKATLPVVQVIKVRPYVSGTMVREALADYAKGGTSTTPGAQQNQSDNEADKARAKAIRDGNDKSAESDGE